MTIQRSEQVHNAFWKIFVSISLSTFYFTMLAWPFGLTQTGYMASRAFLAGAIMFAISIPAWIINIKREFFSDEMEAAKTAEAKAPVYHTIGQLALNNKWLSPSEIEQIIFCQEADGETFGRVAVKRNFLTLTQVKSLLAMQSSMKKEPSMEAVES
ncbi:MAG: hypothetical protein M0T76_06735 [Desulfobacteraceae bacterium]|nr:hypothetical protein [Desulfobacteraceae bacterium]